jgi:hypothetical protein
MTRVDLRCPLLRPLTDEDATNIARVHGVYGLLKVQLELPSMDALAVEYDASRLTARDVESALVRYGLPIARTFAF